MRPGKSEHKRRHRLLRALDLNWQTEMSGFYTYQELARRESDPIRAEALRLDDLVGDVAVGAILLPAQVNADADRRRQQDGEHDRCPQESHSRSA